MPNPLFLKIMDAKIWEYNSLTSEEKTKFADEAQKKLAELHENDIETYNELTSGSK